jgi:two-component system chemotaxis response regulator CheY
MGKKIIVIDDSSAARMLLRRPLVVAGYEVIEAVDGFDGLAKIADHTDAALAICDINMPNLDGLEMLAALRAEQPHLKTPIIMLTIEAAPELLRRAKQSGAKGWVVKPFKVAMLMNAVHKHAGSPA